jgi:hypothetical protein
MPDARIVTCISVSTTPGAKPKTRTPDCAVSRVSAVVSIAYPALAQQ